MPKESDLKKACTRRIKDRGGWARSIPSGPAGAGLPDLMFFYRGYGGGIETKLPGKEHTLTKLQAATLDGIRQGGGIAKVITAVSQVNELLDRIDRAKEARKRR